MQRILQWFAKNRFTYLDLVVVLGVVALDMSWLWTVVALVVGMLAAGFIEIIING
jgi:hypothetical protein